MSPAPNTTFVSPPSFDGSTTLEMSTVGASSGHGSGPSSAATPAFPTEHVDRTEMLGEVSSSVPLDSVLTRTQVPLLELARPTSVTPPPVVDTGRPASKTSVRAQRAGRLFAFGAAALGVLLVGGVVLRRAGSANLNGRAPLAQTPVPTPTVAVAAAAATTASPAQPTPAASPAASAPLDAVAAPAAAPSAAVTASASALAGQNFPVIPDVKRSGLTPPVHAKAAPAASGLFLRALSLHPPAAAAKARPAVDPPMPASGL